MCYTPFCVGMVAEPGGLDLLHYLPHGRICYLALTTQRPGLLQDLGYTLSAGRLVRSLFGYHLVFPLSLMEPKAKNLVPCGCGRTVKNVYGYRVTEIIRSDPPDDLGQTINTRQRYYGQANLPKQTPQPYQSHDKITLCQTIIDPISLAGLFS